MSVEKPGHDILLTVLGCPARMTDLIPADWDQLLVRARACRCLARLAVDAQAIGVDRLPDRVRSHFQSATIEAAHGAQSIRWEINRIERALVGVPVPVLLLKGAAYVAAGLAVAKGRLVSDIDVMVPREALEEVERALIQAGWQLAKLEPYDQRYYRTWMHELPPLRHIERGTFVDVHHTILPPTSRLKPDPALLWSRARLLDESRFYVLAPTDMVLHSAAHLFHDGDLNGSLRDLIDIRDLTGDFGSDSGFWTDLVARAAVLDLGRPLFYALRYCRRLLRSEPPAEAMLAVARFAPPAPVLSTMDRLVPRALAPGEVRTVLDHAATMLLYIRSHWLRMPPALLVPHLVRQAGARLAGS
jgi:hypothetical protein